MSVINRLMGLRNAAPASSAAPAAKATAPKTHKRKVVAKDEPPPKSDYVAFEPGFVARVVKLADSEPETGRLGSDLIHVSALANGSFCPRAHVLARRHGIEAVSNIRPQQRIVWALGRAAENHVRRQFIRMHGKHRVLGKWECRCGHLIREGFGRDGFPCERCGGQAEHYGELDLYDPELGIGGHPDLVFVAANGTYVVVEIKSIRKADYEKLFKPQPDHVIQCHYYVRTLRDGLQRDGIDAPVIGVILYVAKDYVNTSPYLEFDLPAEAPAIIEVLDGHAATVQSAEAANTTPPRLAACTSMAATRAKNCEACTLCFQLSK